MQSEFSINYLNPGRKLTMLFVHFITYFKTQNCLPFASVKTFGLPAALSKPPAFVATCFVAMARPYEQTNEQIKDK